MAPLVDGHLEGVQDQLRLQMSSIGPAHYPPAPCVHDNCQVEISRPVERFVISAIRNRLGPTAMKLRWTRSGGGRLLAWRLVARTDLRRLTPQACSAHKAGDALASHRQSLINQSSVDAGCPIGTSGMEIDPTDPLRQDGVHSRPSKWRPAEPRSEAACSPALSA